MAIFTREPGWERAFQSKRCCGRVCGSPEGVELLPVDHGESPARPELLPFDHGKSPAESGKSPFEHGNSPEGSGKSPGRCGEMPESGAEGPGRAGLFQANGEAFRAGVVIWKTQRRRGAEIAERIPPQNLCVFAPLRFQKKYGGS